VQHEDSCTGCFHDIECLAPAFSHKSVFLGGQYILCELGSRDGTALEPARLVGR